MVLKKNRMVGSGHIFRSVSALAGSSLLSSVLGAVGGVLVARFINPEIAGTFRSYTIPLMYLTFLHLGTFDGLHRQIPFYMGRGLQDDVNSAASASGAWNVFVALAVSTVFLALAISNFITRDYQSATGWLSQAVVCWSVFYVGYLGATYRTVNHFVAVAKINLIQTVMVFLLVFTLPVLGFYGLCLRAAGPTFVVLYLYHHFRPLKMPLKFNFPALKSVVSIGLPLCFWGTLDTSLWLALENSFLLKMGGVKALGLFAVVCVMREGLSVLTRSVQQVFAPRIIEKFSREGSLRQVTSESMKLSMLLVALMLVCVPVLSLCLDYFVPLLIPRYVDGLSAMKLALWVMVVEAASLPLNALFATGKAWIYGRGVLAGLFMFAIVVMLLLPHIGALLAVVAGSLAGRFIRVMVCYIDLYILIRREVCTGE
jgi:hypothetical protein